MSDLPDLDPREPGIFQRILDEAKRIRATRQGRMGEIREKARLVREAAVTEFRRREEEAERRRGAARRQRVLDGLDPDG